MERQNNMARARCSRAFTMTNNRALMNVFKRMSYFWGCTAFHGLSKLFPYQNVVPSLANAREVCLTFLTTTSLFLLCIILQHLRDMNQGSWETASDSPSLNYTGWCNAVTIEKVTWHKSLIALNMHVHRSRDQQGKWLAHIFTPIYVFGISSTSERHSEDISNKCWIVAWTVGLVVCTENEQPVGLGSIFNNCKLHLKALFKMTLSVLSTCKHESQCHMWPEVLNTSITFYKHLINIIMVFWISVSVSLARQKVLNTTVPISLSHFFFLWRRLLISAEIFHCCRCDQISAPVNKFTDL